MDQVQVNHIWEPGSIISMQINNNPKAYSSMLLGPQNTMDKIPCSLPIRHEVQGVPRRTVIRFGRRMGAGCLALPIRSAMLADGRSDAPGNNPVEIVPISQRVVSRGVRQRQNLKQWAPVGR
jgi:hypothetical protein